jgi:cobalt-zinc-cadmium efflux system membrane fusion protein
MKPLLILVFALLIGAARAGPGAHGPGGEHLDAPGAHSPAGAQPQMEAASESVELVARRAAGELSILVDRFDTNEPVLRAQLEVEFGGRKARAKYHEDHGDYSVDDPAFLKALATPGDHPLVFTLVAGNESDLLTGVLAVPKAQAPHEEHRPWKTWAAIGGALLAVVAIAAALLRRRRAASSALALLLLATMSMPWAGPGAHGPGGEHLDAPPGTGGASGLARLADGSINVPKLAQRRMEIRTVLATETEAAATIEMPGRVIMDPNAGGRVQPAHGGRVEAGPGGLPVAGKMVRKGEVLAYVRHHAEPFAAAGQRSQLSEIRAARDIAEKKVKRLESLEGTVPRKEIEAARAELASLQARQGDIGASLHAREALLAPISGVIARADAVAGQVVEGGQLMYEIVDPGRVLVEATTPDVALANALGAARVREAGGVRLDKIGVARTLREGVLPVTFRAQAEKAGAALPLAIGQTVTVVAALAEKRKGIVLPASSVVRGASNEPTVFIKVGAERFMPQPVEARPIDANTVMVVKGLAPDNRVVVQGASLLAQIR